MTPVTTFSRIPLIVLLAATVAAQRPPALEDIDAKARKLAPQLQAATVTAWAGSGGSGVIVSPDGYVVTAAHVLKKPEGRIQVVMSDGRRAAAKLVGILEDHDIAVLKITKRGPWPYRELGGEELPRRGSVCLATGVPGGQRRDRPPPLRVGAVTDHTAALLRTTCALTMGDSGGPLFDLDGRVIGVHSRVGIDPGKNYHVPVGVVRRAWDDLIAGKGRATRYAPKRPPPKPRKPVTSWRGKRSIRAVAGKVARAARASLVRIEAGKRRIYGTVVEPDAIVTKASESAQRAFVVTPDGRRLEARRVAIDATRDLALLVVDADDLTPVPLAKVPLVSGQVLVSPIHHGGVWISVVSAPARKVGGIGGHFGAFLEKAEPGARVTRVRDGSAAAKAGLQTGDTVLAFDGRAVKGPSDLLGLASTLDPGAKVLLRIRRDGAERDVAVTLGARRERQLGSGPHPFKNLPLSRRRSGFSQAVQHDALLLPRQCGGPVVDLEGRCVAVNVARSGRHASLALPASEVATFVRRAR